jgi:hypothetical protein
MRVTLYLPDELRERARDAGLNLSALLRQAVEDELRGDEKRPVVSIERDGDVYDVRVRFSSPTSPLG